MNILISTTTNWNPGDDFIRYGVMQLLGNEHNYIYYDRNPDYFKQDIWEMGCNHKSNIMNDPIDWSLIDMVVLAGSPEFIHGPLKPLYDGLIENEKIPLLAIGVGYTFQMDTISFTPTESIVLKRKNTKIITRQYDLQKLLSEHLTREDIDCLPCPAIFAPIFLNTVDATKLSGKDSTLHILQSNKGHQAISEEDFDETNKLKNVQSILTYYVDDLKEYPYGKYIQEPQEIGRYISKYPRVISNRLHGGIYALGNGSKVKFINSSNRVQKALEPYSIYKDENGWYNINDEELYTIELQYKHKLKGFI